MVPGEAPAGSRLSLVSLRPWLRVRSPCLWGMTETMRSASDLNDLPYLMLTAFVFGIIHAFMPGHGKSVLVSYHLGRRSRLVEGIATGVLLASTHVGIAIVFVLARVAVISRSVAAGGRAPAFQALSAALIGLLVPICCSAHSGRPSTVTFVMGGCSIATGLVPCPLTTLFSPMLWREVSWQWAWRPWEECWRE